jgi:protein ImuB
VTTPSYDDLTPGIPGVVDAETAGNLASLLRDRPASAGMTAGRPASGSQLPVLRYRLPASGFPLPASAEATAGEPGSGLYACLRLKAGGGTPEAGSRQLEVLLAIARDFSPRVRRAAVDEVLLDVSGLGRLIGPPEEIARQLTQALFDAGQAASVALGPTQTIARVLAQVGAAGHGRPVQHEGHNDHEDQTRCDLCALRDRCVGACGRGPWLQLPVELLRELEVLPPAITDRDRARVYETLGRWGVVTLGGLAALPAVELSSRLGRRGLALQRLACGLDPAPFVPDGETPRYVGRLELEWPLDTLEPLSFVFARLLEPLSALLERADRGAVAVRLDLRLTDRATHARVLQLPAPIRDARILRTLLLLDLESSPLFAAASDVMIDAVGLELDPAPARITQFSLLQRALPSPETLATLAARLSALVGESRVGSPALVDSHRADAFAMKKYAPEGANGINGAKGAKGAKGANSAGANGAGANGAGANGAGGLGAVLRRERRSVALSVRLEHGRPVHLASSRRSVPYGAIVQAAGPWRTSGEWWSDQRWNHHEWDVALKSGAVCRIYQDRTTGRWFFEGLYD